MQACLALGGCSSAHRIGRVAAEPHFFCRGGAPAVRSQRKNGDPLEAERRHKFFAAVHESPAVKVFGRLHDDPIHTRRGQAYEKHQWTKSREVGRLRRHVLYGGLTGTPTPMLADGTSRDKVDGAFKPVMPSPA